MIANYKRAFVEKIDERHFIVYPISPITGKIIEFRRKEFNKIPRGDRFFKVSVEGSRLKTVEKNGILIHIVNGECHSDDTFEASEIGYRPPIKKEAYFKTQGYIPSKTHMLLHVDRPPTNDEFWNTKTNYFNADKEDTVTGQPFRVSYPSMFQQRIKNFALFESYSRDYNKPSMLVTINGIIQLTDLAYIEQLLMRNKIELLRKRASDSDLNNVFGLYSIGDGINIDFSNQLDEEKVKAYASLLLGEKDGSTITEDTILANYNEQAIADSHLIEYVKQYKKINKGGKKDE